MHSANTCSIDSPDHQRLWSIAFAIEVTSSTVVAVRPGLIAFLLPISAGMTASFGSVAEVALAHPTRSTLVRAIFIAWAVLHPVIIRCSSADGTAFGRHFWLVGSLQSCLVRSCRLVDRMQV